MANRKYWSTTKTKKEGVFRAKHQNGATAWLVRVRRRDWRGNRVAREALLPSELTLEQATLERAKLAVALDVELRGDAVEEPPQPSEPKAGPVSKDGPEPMDGPEPAQSPTLWDFCRDVYSKQHGVSDRTWRQRRYKVAGIMNDLGAYRIDAVTTSIVTAWLHRLRTQGAPRKDGSRGKPLGDEAVNDYVVTLRAIYRVARHNDAIDTVPFANASARIVLDTDRVSWTRSMRTRLLETAETEDPGMWRLARFLMLTGCRPIEALRLRCRHIEEIPRRRLTITGKGFRRRHLPLDGELAAFIDSIEHSGDAIFGVERGARTGEAFKYWPQRRWERVCAKADVPSVAYDLRHTFITEMVAAGAPLAKVARWCGNSVRVIEERYSHLAPDHLTDILALCGRSDPTAENTKNKGAEDVVTPVGVTTRGDHD